VIAGGAPRAAPAHARAVAAGLAGVARLAAAAAVEDVGGEIPAHVGAAGVLQRPFARDGPAHAVAAAADGAGLGRAPRAASPAVGRVGEEVHAAAAAAGRGVLADRRALGGLAGPVDARLRGVALVPAAPAVVAVVARVDAPPRAARFAVRAGRVAGGIDADAPLAVLRGRAGVVAPAAVLPARGHVRAAPRAALERGGAPGRGVARADAGDAHVAEGFADLPAPAAVSHVGPRVDAESVAAGEVDLARPFRAAGGRVAGIGDVRGLEELVGPGIRPVRREHVHGAVAFGAPESQERDQTKERNQRNRTTLHVLQLYYGKRV